jgi:hypothetical protein
MLMILIRNTATEIMKIVLDTVVITLVLIMALSCNDTVENLVNPQPPQPGRRDYTWELDTLDMPMNYLGAVWGAVPNDVWAVGAGGTFRDRLQHYDGKEWSAYNKEAILCTGNTLYGFSEDNVWMGGGDEASTGAGIWHYDGNKWTRNYIYSVKGEYSTEVTDLWGLSPNNIFACGYIGYKGSTEDSLRGFVLHYDGNSWTEVAKGDKDYQFLTIRSEHTFPSSFFDLGDKSFILAYKLGNERSDSEIFAFYELDGNNLRRIYSNTRGNIHYANLSVINGTSFFLINQDVYTYKNNSFVKEFSVYNPNIVAIMSGRNSKDIFFDMNDGIVNYNGSDFEYIYRFPVSMSILGQPLIFKNDVFFIIWDKSGPQIINEILHGALK